MKLLFALRKENFKKTLPGAMLCILVGVFEFMLLGVFQLPLLLTPVTFAEVDPQNMHGVYIEDKVSLIHARYFEEFDSDNQAADVAAGVQYLIALNDTFYVSFYVHDEQIAQTTRLEEASYRYFAGEMPIEALPALFVKGSFVPMDEEAKQLYYELAGGNSGVEALMLPYTLDTNMVGTAHRGMAWFGLGTSMLMVAFGFMFLVFAVNGTYEKKLFASLDIMGDREQGLEKLDHFYRTTPAHYKIRIGEEFVLFRQGMHSILLRPWNVAWVYRVSTKHIGHGIVPIFKTSSVRLRTTGGDSYTIYYKKKQLDSAIDFLLRRLPKARFGYDDEIVSIYHTNVERSGPLFKE